MSFERECKCWNGGAGSELLSSGCAQPLQSGSHSTQGYLYKTKLKIGLKKQNKTKIGQSWAEEGTSILLNSGYWCVLGERQSLSSVAYPLVSPADSSGYLEPLSKSITPDEHSGPRNKTKRHVYQKRIYRERRVGADRSKIVPSPFLLVTQSM